MTNELDALGAVGKQLARVDKRRMELIAQRGELIVKAKKTHTWRELAEVLSITEKAVINAHAASLKRLDGDD